MTIANHIKYSGGPKDWDGDNGAFQFEGTTTTANVPTTLRKIVSAVFNGVTETPTGSAGTLDAGWEYLLVGTAIGTADSTALLYGGVTVNGTAIRVDRHQLAPGSPSVTGTGVAAFGGTYSTAGQWVQYIFYGYR